MKTKLNMCVISVILHLLNQVTLNNTRGFTLERNHFSVTSVILVSLQYDSMTLVSFQCEQWDSGFSPV